MRLILFRLIGILEVAGGFYGMALMLHRLLPPGSFHTALPTLIAFALYEGGDRGVHLSSIAQLLQLPLIATPIFHYGLYCGAFINVLATLHLPPHLMLDWHYGSENFVLALTGPAVSLLGINLLALLSWLALRLR